MRDDGRYVITFGTPDQLQNRPNQTARSRDQPCQHCRPVAQPPQIGVGGVRGAAVEGEGCFGRWPVELTSNGFHPLGQCPDWADRASSEEGRRTRPQQFALPKPPPPASLTPGQNLHSRCCAAVSQEAARWVLPAQPPNTSGGTPSSLGPTSPNEGPRVSQSSRGRARSGCRRLISRAMSATGTRGLATSW